MSDIYTKEEMIEALCRINSMAVANEKFDEAHVEYIKLTGTLVKLDYERLYDLFTSGDDKNPERTERLLKTFTRTINNIIKEVKGPQNPER